MEYEENKGLFEEINYLMFLLRQSKPDYDIETNPDKETILKILFYDGLLKTIIENIYMLKEELENLQEEYDSLESEHHEKKKKTEKKTGKKKVASKKKSGKKTKRKE